MSGDSHEEDAPGFLASVDDLTQSDTVAVGAAELRLEELADQMSAILDACPAAEREALHDYAVSLVRDRLPVAESMQVVDTDLSEPAESSPARTTNAASLVGYGVLLLPVGFLLSIVFPLGILLVMGGLVMVGLGIVMALVSRLVPKRTSARD